MMRSSCTYVPVGRVYIVFAHCVSSKEFKTFQVNKFVGIFGYGIFIEYFKLPTSKSEINFQDN